MADGGNPPSNSYASGAYNSGYYFFTQKISDSGSTTKSFFHGISARGYTGTKITDVGFYWINSSLDAYHVGCLHFNSNYVGPFYGNYAINFRSRANAVRPVVE